MLGLFKKKRITRHRKLPTEECHEPCCSCPSCPGPFQSDLFWFFFPPQKHQFKMIPKISRSTVVCHRISLASKPVIFVLILSVKMLSPVTQFQFFCLLSALQRPSPRCNMTIGRSAVEMMFTLSLPTSLFSTSSPPHSLDFQVAPRFSLTRADETSHHCENKC